jgi:hypothetical protein
MFESRIKGKRLLGLGMVLALLVTVGIWQVSMRTGQAQSVGGFNGAKVIVNNLSLTELTSAATATPGTAFYKEGTLSIASRTKCPLDTGTNTSGLFVPDGSSTAVGKVRIWGVSAGGGALAIHVNIELPGYNGTLVGQGTLFGTIVDGLHPTPPPPTILTSPCQPFGDDIIAITGGTSGFRGASGEASVIRQSDGSVVIRLQETPRRGGDLDIDR